MENIRDKWLAGVITFQELYRQNESHSTATLAETLGIPFPGSVIAVRAADCGQWDEDDHISILLAQQDYDAGLVEMMTGRVGVCFVLYAFRLKRRVPRRRYFTDMQGE